MERAATAFARILPQILRGVPPLEIPLLAWPLICGTQVAARTRAVAVAGGVLRVEVPDAAWRAQLMDLTPRYLASIQQIFNTCARQSKQCPADVAALRVDGIEFILPPGAAVGPRRGRPGRRENRKLS